MGITSALLKLYMTITTALSNNITLNEISMLKVNIKFIVFQEFFGKLGRLKISQLYEVMKKTKALIMKYCGISHVSQRDQKAGKSYEYIFKGLANA